MEFPKILATRQLSAFLAASALALPGVTAEPISPAPTPEQEKALLKEVRVPDGFEATIFAVPPAVNYPVFVASSPDGTVFVSSDRNGSLDRGPNRGRVLRVRDIDGDGHADEVKEFVPNVDSPRGLVWERNRLYLLHPPHLSVFIDHDGDGVSDEQKILVKNIAFTFKDRPADHSSNGIELGIDGWIYCAIGDFGFLEAEGTDGRKLQLRGGGVVRVRPDGTQMELYSRGTRNILEVAVSPKLDLFARDNTNDGGGWDIRLHHFAPLSEHGYPSLYKNFKGEFIEPLADYGGGSGCGGMFLDEPGFPAGFSPALYTADWGREWVYRHELTPKGATFTASQQEFVRAPRVTDLDADGLGNIYVASWKGATFTYAGENVGFLVRVRPQGFQADPLPNFRTASNFQLAKVLESPSHVRRLAAQRELLQRSDLDVNAIYTLAGNAEMPLATRIAATFLLKQKLGRESHPMLVNLMKDASIQEYALRALCDNPEENAGIPDGLLARLLHSENPRVRQQAAFGLARVSGAAHASAIASLLGDPDPVVAHTAMRALRSVKGYNAAFAVLDSPGSSEADRTGALQVLNGLHEKAVVDGILTRLEGTQSTSHRRQLLTLLCRLHYTDGEWKGDSWGTRPDTSGPYYQAAEWSETPRIAAALMVELNRAPVDEAAFLLGEFGRHKLQNEESLILLAEMAGKKPELIPTATAQLARADQIPAPAVAFLTKIATQNDATPEARAGAVVALAKIGTKEAAEAMLAALPDLYQSGARNREAQQARQAFLRSRNAEAQLDLYTNLAAQLDSPAAPWAEARLLALADSRGGSSAVREQARRATDAGWENSKRRVQILHAIALAEHRPARKRVLEALDDADPAVAEAAREAARILRLERRPKKPAEPTVAELKETEVIQRAFNMRGDVKLGAELFTRQTCSSCHTVSASEALRGPFLGNIATIYKRDELAAAILIPNKSIAQGFTAYRFDLKDGELVEGFVTQEAADKVTLRNVAAQEIVLKTEAIARRTKLDKSLMPEGLAANLTLREFASLLDYLQDLAAKEAAGK